MHLLIQYRIATRASRNVGSLQGTTHPVNTTGALRQALGGCIIKGATKASVSVCPLEEHFNLDGTCTLGQSKAGILDVCFRSGGFGGRLMPEQGRARLTELLRASFETVICTCDGLKAHPPFFSTSNVHGLLSSLASCCNRSLCLFAVVRCQLESARSWTWTSTHREQYRESWETFPPHIHQITSIRVSMEVCRPREMQR